MKEGVFGKLSVRITGGTDGNGGGHGPVVVLLHGFGAPGDDLVPLWKVLASNEPIRFIFPVGPLRLPDAFSDSRAWWLLDMEKIARDMANGQRRDTYAIPHGLIEARASVITLLDDLEQQWKISTSQMVLGGFSQGATLACDVILHTTRPFAGLVMMSGTIISQKEWEQHIPARQGLPVFQSHGTQDPLLAFDTAEHFRDMLMKGGLPVDWHPFQGGHEIPYVVLDGLKSFLNKRFG